MIHSITVINLSFYFKCLLSIDEISEKRKTDRPEQDIQASKVVQSIKNVISCHQRVYIVSASRAIRCIPVLHLKELKQKIIVNTTFWQFRLPSHNKWTFFFSLSKQQQPHIYYFVCFNIKLIKSINFNELILTNKQREKWFNLGKMDFGNTFSTIIHFTIARIWH